MVSPGEILQEALDDRGISQSELARRMGRPTKTINEIVNGKAQLTPDTAIQLELALGISRAFWNHAEVGFRAHQASTRAEEAWASSFEWAERFPLKEMRARKIIVERDPALSVQSLLAFFGVASPNAWESRWAEPGAVFKRQTSFEMSDFALAVWLREGELLAEEIQTEPFDPVRLRAVLKLIRPLTRQEPVSLIADEVRGLLASAGVALVLLPEYSKLPVSGAACWMSKEKARIQLTARFKTNDSFWFSLFHECGHLISKRGQDFVEWDDAGQAEADETEANRFARDTLIEPRAFATFVRAKDFSRDAVRDFSKANSIAAGIVVGRLQHDDYIGRGALRDFRKPLDWG